MDIDEPLQLVGVGAPGASPAAGPAAAPAGGAGSAGSAGGANVSAAMKVSKSKVQLGVKGAPLGWKEGEDYDDDDDYFKQKEWAKVCVRECACLCLCQ